MIDAGERPMIQTRISTFASRLLQASGKALMVACLFTSSATAFGKVDVTAGGASSEWIEQLQRAASLVDNGQLDSAEAVYRRALRDAEQDGDDLRAAVVLHNIGGLLEHKGEFREVEKALLRAIGALKRAATGDERLMVRTSAALAVVQIQMGQYSKAEALIRSVLVNHRAGVAFASRDDGLAKNVVTGMFLLFDN